MNNKPLISVILSVYNAEQYLEEAIQSILNQTYKNFEFIIIDDGSKDNSLGIIREYRKRDKRIVVITRENKGLIESLNEGIKAANGKYIARMDADDIAMPNRFEEQIKYMESHEEVVVCGSFIETFGSKKMIRKYPISNADIRAYFVFKSPFAHPATMIRTKILTRKMYDNHYTHAEDYKLWMDLMSEGEMYNIPKVLLKYRVTPEQITSAFKNESIIISKQIRREYINMIFYSINSKLKVPCNIYLKDIRSLENISGVNKTIINSIRQVYYLSLDQYSFSSFLNFLLSGDYLFYPYSLKSFFRILYYHFKKNSPKWL